jgi:hypothetical protein
MDLKVGDYLILDTRWALKDMKHYRKIIKVTGTDVYLENSLYPRGARFEITHVKKYWRKATKLELLLDGIE